MNSIFVSKVRYVAGSLSRDSLGRNDKSILSRIGFFAMMASTLGSIGSFFFSSASLFPIHSFRDCFGGRAGYDSETSCSFANGLEIEERYTFHGVFSVSLLSSTCIFFPTCKVCMPMV